MALQGETVCRYLEDFPTVPSKTLARMILAEHAALFKNEDSVRSLIRLYRGKLGNSLRKYAKFEYDSQYCPFENLPEGLIYYEQWEPYYIDCQRALVIADPHIPYHNKDALRVALDYGYQQDVDTLLLLGDFVDFYSVSFWEKDPRKRRFSEELKIVVSVLKLLRDCFQDAKIILKLGNHEERYERYMRVKAPELLGVEEFELTKILHLDDFDIQLIGEKRICKIAKLNIIHGHEFGRTISSPVNPARGLYLKGKEHCLGAHYHQTSNHSENSMNDNFTGCWSLGCLCDLHPPYLPINKWNFGFAVVDKINEKAFEVHNKKIIDNKVYAA